MIGKGGIFGRFDGGLSGESCKGNLNERQCYYTYYYIVRLISRSGAQFNCYPKFRSPKRHNGIDVMGITPSTPLCTLHTGLVYGALHTYRSSQTLIQCIRASQAKSALCLIVLFAFGMAGTLGLRRQIKTDGPLGKGHYHSDSMTYRFTVLENTFTFRTSPCDAVLSFSIQPCVKFLSVGSRVSLHGFLHP